MIAKEDENDNEVRREDQDRINQFARLNARLQDNKSEREQIKVWIFIELDGCDVVWHIFNYLQFMEKMFTPFFRPFN